jgi:hypothetical protein
VSPLTTYGEVYTQSVVAAASLFAEFADLFRYVEPATPNLVAYGHRFRELVILACTEVEACWRGALKSNSPSGRSDRYTTADYVRLHAPMRLGEWVVTLDDYPSVPKLAPFASWTVTHATQSLPWYDAYNAIKHDREGAFSRATLGTVVDAMAAVFVMQCAQWGPEVYSPFHGARDSPFTIAVAPKWEAPDLYVPDPAASSKWTADQFFP